MASIKNDNAVDYLPSGSNNKFDVANLVLKLLRSRDGVVLRRLWMTAVSATFDSLNRRALPKTYIYVPNICY